MRVRAGTSGYSYAAWKGIFYPRGLPASRMLSYYASKLPAVEINNTFYRMPRPEMLGKWRDESGEGFRFVLKAPRRITHIARLKDVTEAVSHFFAVAMVLGDKLGPVLFQLPPFFKKDLSALRDFLGVVPEGPLVAFEFRNASWFDDAVFTVLSERDAALCVGDVDDAKKAPPFQATASWGYLRLRRSDYEPRDIESWAGRIQSQSWQEAYAFFKHEERGPELAEQLNALCGEVEIPKNEV